MNIDWKAEEYKGNFSFVPQYGESVIDLLSSEKGSLVIDLGCGNGSLSKKLLNLGYRVVGIDDSDAMLSLARKNYPDITFLKGNAVNFKYPGVDAIFSNAVLHWIDSNKQQDMLDNLSSNLKPGGELVFEMGGKDCASLIHRSLDSIFKKRGLEYRFNFFFPTIGEYAPMLEKAGLIVTDAFYFPRMTKQEGTIKDWILMFDTYPFKNIDTKTRNEIIAECEERVKDRLFIDGSWYVDYTRLRMRAVKSC